MNHTDLTSRIVAVKARLTQAQTLADRLAEMQAAAEYTRVHGPAEIAALEEQLAEAQAAERMKSDALSRFRIVRIEAGSGGLLAPRKVVYVERCHGVNGPEDRQGEQWLGGTTPELWYAILATPKLISADIRVLAADPAEAVRIWVGHRTRGYVRG